MATLDCLACTMQFVKLFVTLFLTFVFHFKFVPHTTTTDYLNFTVCISTYCSHLCMSYHYAHNTVQYF
jgi:hypothetical protein